MGEKRGIKEGKIGRKRVRGREVESKMKGKKRDLQREKEGKKRDVEREKQGGF